MSDTVSNATGLPLTGQDIVEAFYQALLGRPADPAGLKQKAERFDRGEASIRDLANEFVQSEEFAARIPKLLASRPIDDAAMRLTSDVSQYGELWLLLRRWVNAQAHCGLVVDVGARGRERSNSYDLMRHFGWSGLLVEANPALLASIRSDFAGCAFELVSCAVSDYSGSATFTIGSNDDVSSLDPSLAENWGTTRGVVEVEVRRLAEVLSEHAIPERFDLLSLDIEGEDIKVLNDLVEHSAFRPDWIIIEASHDFQVRTLTDAPFAPAVRDAYAVVDTTRANLILGRRHPEWDAWMAGRPLSRGGATA